MTYIIWGPPGSGKTTYAKLNMTDGDIIIDFDLLCVALTGMDSHKYEESLRDRIEGVREFLLNTCLAYPEIRHTWITVCRPRTVTRYLSHANVEKRLMPTPERECIRRCVYRGGEFTHWQRIVKKWFEEFGDEVPAE